MKSYKLSAKQVIRILLIVVVFGTLFVLPDVFKPYFIDNEIVSFSIYTTLSILFQITLFIVAIYLDRKYPRNVNKKEIEKVKIPLWRGLLMFSFILITLFLFVQNL